MSRCEAMVVETLKKYPDVDRTAAAEQKKRPQPNRSAKKAA